jgi:hypothetical protein
MNKHLSTFALVGALALAGAPAFAAETKAEAQADVNASAGAVIKDEAVIQKQQDNLAANRASKAANKAEGDLAGQAVDSVKIGANQATIEAKKGEKEADKEILKHDQKKLDEHK